MKGVEPMKYRIVDREAFQVIGIKREALCCAEENSPAQDIGQFWRKANENGLVARLVQLLNGEIKGLLGIVEKYNEKKNTVDYWITAEHSGDIPAGYSSLEFPAAKWVVFEVKGPIPTAMVNTWKRIYSEWFPSNGFEPAELAPIEAYIDTNLHSPNSMNEIWVAIK